MQEAYHALEQRILDYLTGPADGFENLALDIFRFQFAHNVPYRTYCESLELTPEKVGIALDIPSVPTPAFRSGPALTCVPAEDCERVFLTSGTTTEVRGRHFLRNTALYQASVRHGWKHAGLPRDLPALFLSRPPTATPDSSLACMFGFLHDPARGPENPWMLTAERSIELSIFDEVCAAGQPILLFSTALALRHLFEKHPHCGPLPHGSWVFQTGGYKGLAATYEPASLYRDIESVLGVPPHRIINEYGMTELSSASYALGPESPHRTPPWLRVRTINPETNQPGAPGEDGHLVFHDLANLNSVAAVRTQDLGCALDEHTFILTGRDPSALPRGCSRASDAHLQSS